MKEDLRRLLALYAIDREIQETRGRIRGLEGEISHIESRMEAEEKAFAQRVEAHKKLRHRATEKALEADEMDEKIRTYQHKLEHDIIPYKEMEYLKEQVELLRSRIDQVEEEAIRLMEEAEADARRLSEEEEAHKARLRELEEEKRKLEDKIAELEGHLKELEGERQRAAAAVPAHLLSHYQRLLEMYSDPVVPIVGGTCGGCHLNISQITLDRARQGEVVTCDNCSRFLYLESAL